MGTITKERWEEILLEEGMSQFAIGSLWADRPDNHELHEESTRLTAKEMLGAGPDWHKFFTRENDSEPQS